MKSSWAVLALIASGPTLALAQADLLAPPPQTFVAPGRLFSVEMPPNWQVVLTNDPYTVQFNPAGPGDALMWLRRIEVPTGAHPRQLLLNAVEQRLSKLPHYKEVSRRNVTISGRPGASVIATFSHQGNIQFPRAMEEVFVVAGAEAFIIHFECFEPNAGPYASGLDKFYSSFMPRPGAGPGSGGVFDDTPSAANPLQPQQDVLPPAVDQLPF